MGTDWRLEGGRGSGWGENRDWFLERREPRDRSVVSLDTRWDVVWPTTPLWNRGGISMDSEEPRELELSRRARLEPVTEISSDGRRILLPDSSARTAMTCLGSVLLLSLSSLRLRSVLSTEQENLLKGL